MPCPTCNGTGVNETGNNDLPCDCPAGATARFNVAGVKGDVSGAEVIRHFLNGSPEPLATSVPRLISADALPGRVSPTVDLPMPNGRPKEPWQA